MRQVVPGSWYLPVANGVAEQAQPELARSSRLPCTIQGLQAVDGVVRGRGQSEFLEVSGCTLDNVGMLT